MSNWFSRVYPLSKNIRHFGTHVHSRCVWLKVNQNLHTHYLLWDYIQLVVTVVCLFTQEFVILGHFSLFLSLFGSFSLFISFKDSFLSIIQGGICHLQVLTSIYVSDFICPLFEMNLYEVLLSTSFSYMASCFHLF